MLQKLRRAPTSSKRKNCKDVNPLLLIKVFSAERQEESSCASAAVSHCFLHESTLWYTMYISTHVQHTCMRIVVIWITIIQRGLNIRCVHVHLLGCGKVISPEIRPEQASSQVWATHSYIDAYYVEAVIMKHSIRGEIMALTVECKVLTHKNNPHLQRLKLNIH